MAYAGGRTGSEGTSGMEGFNRANLWFSWLWRCLFNSMYGFGGGELVLSTSNTPRFVSTIFPFRLNA